MFKHGDWEGNRVEPDELTELITHLNNRDLTEKDDDFLRTEKVLNSIE